MLGPRDLDRYATALAPAIEFVDHRTVGLRVRARRRQRCCASIRALLELADDVAIRIDDVLGLRPDALLVRWTNSGTDRASGGAYERHFLQLWVFGADGLRDAHASSSTPTATPRRSRASTS